MKTAFGILALLGLSACSSSTTSNVKHIKIQTGERLPALVISGEGSGDMPYIESVKASTQCNGDVPRLSLDFKPTNDFLSTDINCSVYGHTVKDGPFWISRQFPKKTILMDPSRFNDSVGYPLGTKLQPTAEAQISVNLCTRMQVAEDVSSEATCLEEKVNFFEKDLVATAEAERSGKVGRAIVEALQVLTYSDTGLSACYEEALLATEDLESQSKMPTDVDYNPFQSMRRRNEFFPATKVEIAVLKDKIKKLPANAAQAYELRYSLAKRLRYTIPKEVSASPLYMAYEPFPLNQWESRNAEAIAVLEKEFGADVKDLATLTVKEIFDRIEKITFRGNGLNIIQAKGYVSGLTRLDEKSPKENPVFKISSSELHLFSDLLYKAVLLAKATKLDPTSIIPKIKGNLAETCADYGNYRFGVKNKRSAIVENYTLSADPDNRPKLSLRPSATPLAVSDEWLIDSTRRKVADGLPPVALHKSFLCGPKDSADFCPMSWASDRNSQYKRINVRIFDAFKDGEKLWKKEVNRPTSEVDIMSGADFQDLVKKGFFAVEGVDPTIEIEGVFDTDAGEGKTLLYSHLLVANPVACGENRVGDVVVTKILDGRKARFDTCAGPEGFKTSETFECDSGDEKCVAVLESLKPAVRYCENGKEVGFLWVWTIEDGDEVEMVTQECVLVNNQPVVQTKAGGIE
ncbi:MAG: hypothetical protein EOP04_09105, partial [Proteobacteria bacterium]